MRLDQANAALPLDVRKGSAFPSTGLFMHRGYASVRAVEAQPLRNSRASLTERQSLSAHQTAEPGTLTSNANRQRQKEIHPIRWAAILMLLLPPYQLFAQQPQPNPPRVFLINAQKLAETKRRIQSGDKTFAAALAKLE